MDVASAPTSQTAAGRESVVGVSVEPLVQRPWLAPAFLAVAAFALYGRALGFGFVSDDVEQVLQNPYVRNPHLWTRIFTTSVWSFEGKAVQSNFYRPLQILCYWLLDRIAGPQPLLFHVFNLAVYIVSALLVFHIGVRLFGRRLPAFLGSLLWVVHPLHVEAAAWVAALPDLGFGFFFLLAFLIFLRTEQSPASGTRGYAWTALAFFPALFFKEAAVSFPLLLVAVWWFKPVSITPRHWTQRIAALGFCALAIGIAVVIRFAALGHLVGAKTTGYSSVRVITSALGLLGENAKIFFYPVHLSIFRTFTPAGSLASPWTWITLLLVIGAIGLRWRAPLTGFLVSWWFVGLIPCLDIRQLSIPYVADRFSYIPSLGLCLAIAGLTLGSGNGVALNSRRLLSGIAALVVIAAVWSVETWRVLPAWQSDASLAAASMKFYPNNAALHLVEAWKLAYHSGDLIGADHEYREAMELNRTGLHPLNTITYKALIGLGQDSEQRGDTKGAIDYLQRAITMFPNLGEAYQVMGSVYFPRRDYERAASYFERAVNLEPMNADLHFYLGTCWLKMGLYNRAAEQLHAALEVDPTLHAASVEQAEALRGGAVIKPLSERGGGVPLR